MRPAKRHDGLVHDRIECPEMGDRFDVVVLGADPKEADDTISVQSNAHGVSVSFRFTRDQARRLGELLIQAADDGVCQKCKAPLDPAFFPVGGKHDVCPVSR